MGVWLIASLLASPTTGLQLRVGDELVYTGDVVEECSRIDMPSRRQSKIEIRYLVLAVHDGSTDLAMLSLLRAQDDAIISKASVDDGKAAAAKAPAVRMCLLRMESSGLMKLLEPASDPPPIAWDRSMPSRPQPGLVLDAANALETGPFPILPSNWKPGTEWTDSSETLRPAMRWTLQPTIVLEGAEVQELGGVQQSEQWQNPTLTDRPWRRTERVWVSPSDGIARVVWRRIERTDGPRPAFRIETRLDLQPTPPRRDESFRSAKREIEFAWWFDRQVAELPKEKHVILKSQIDRYKQDYPATPYREAIEAVSRRLAP